MSSVAPKGKSTKAGRRPSSNDGSPLFHRRTRLDVHRSALKLALDTTHAILDLAFEVENRRLQFRQTFRVRRPQATGMRLQQATGQFLQRIDVGLFQPVAVVGIAHVHVVHRVTTPCPPDGWSPTMLTGGWCGR